MKIFTSPVAAQHILKFQQAGRQSSLLSRLPNCLLGAGSSAALQKQTRTLCATFKDPKATKATQLAAFQQFAKTFQLHTSSLQLPNHRSLMEAYLKEAASAHKLSQKETGQLLDRVSPMKKFILPGAATVATAAAIGLGLYLSSPAQNEMSKADISKSFPQATIPNASIPVPPHSQEAVIPNASIPVPPHSQEAVAASSLTSRDFGTALAALTTLIGPGVIAFACTGKKRMSHKQQINQRIAAAAIATRDQTRAQEEEAKQNHSPPAKKGSKGRTSPEGIFNLAKDAEAAQARRKQH